MMARPTISTNVYLTVKVLRMTELLFRQRLIGPGINSLEISRRNASWKSFFGGSKDKQEGPEEVFKTRKMSKEDGLTTKSELGSLRMKTVTCSVRGYTPPPDVEGRTLSAARDLVSSDVTTDYKLDDSMIKFQLLTSLMHQFDHPIPNAKLTNMNSISDAIEFFSTPVQDRSSYDDMAKLNLPKNLHIQLEPHRFDAETDTFFDGKTAFFDSPTIVADIKYSRKYKGNKGESRNSKMLTNYEKQKIINEERENAPVYDKQVFLGKVLPIEGFKRKKNYKSGGPETEAPVIGN